MTWGKNKHTPGGRRKFRRCKWLAPSVNNMKMSYSLLSKRGCLSPSISFHHLVPPQAETTIGFENILRASFSQVPTNTQHHTPASVLPLHSWDLRQVWEWFCLQGLAWHLRSSRENYNPFCLYLSNKSLPFG